MKRTVWVVQWFKYDKQVAKEEEFETRDDANYAHQQWLTWKRSFRVQDWDTDSYQKYATVGLPFKRKKLRE